jgi:predicted nuclease with TOPRIM domain
MVKIKIPVSPGELTDKVTILEIKRTKIKDAALVKSVKTELKLLEKELAKLLSSKRRLAQKYKLLKAQLYRLNSKLWNIENTTRGLEARKSFGRKFVQTARSVYINNDKRSEIKKSINKLFGSDISEAKQYSRYK